LLCLLAVGASIAIYPSLPSLVASHWGADGQVNGYMSRFWGVFLLPLVMIFLAALFQVLPRLDPTHRNTDELREQMGSFGVVITLFFLVIHALMLAWNLGYEIPFNVVLPVLMGGLFYFIGDLCLHAKRNWFMGVRTPWTLTSDLVWDKTNQLAGKMFKACGVIAILSALAPQCAFWIVLAPLLATVVISFVYSYRVYNQQKAG
jgi:uncharacterized membrane protein